MRPGYKLTEVGVIPDDWEVQTLNDVSTISRLAGAEYTSHWKETPGGEIIALRGFNIGQGRIIERDFVRISNRLSLKLQRSRLCSGDVVYPCVGSIGNAVVITEDAKYHIQQNIARITPMPNTICPHYLADFLMSALAQREVERFTSSSSQPSVLVGSLRQYRIPLPPTLPEQRAISAALSDVEALLRGLDRLIAKKQDVKQAAMQQLLNGQTRLPGFHGEWATGQLGSFVRSHNSGIYKKSELYGQGCNIVGVSDLYGTDCVDGQRFTQVPLSTAEQAKHTLKGNDLLYGESSLVREGIARTVHVTERGAGTAFAWHTRRYSVDQSVLNSRFLYYYLQGWRARKHMMDQCIQTAITGINTIAYFGCPVLIPSVPEQNAIATVLSDMDAELAVLEQRRDKTCALKEGMMQELLTGRTRLV